MRFILCYYSTYAAADICSFPLPRCHITSPAPACLSLPDAILRHISPPRLRFRARHAALVSAYRYISFAKDVVVRLCHMLLSILFFRLLVYAVAPDMLPC